MNFDKFYNILYTIDSQFPGQHILLPKGLVIIEKLKYIMRCLYKQYNCVEISTASFGTCNIWDKTKHTEKYLENMFKISDKYYLKPMNCPMHIELMKSIYAKNVVYQYVFLNLIIVLEKKKADQQIIYLDF